MELTDTLAGLMRQQDAFSVVPKAVDITSLPGLLDLELQLRLGAHSIDSLFAAKEGAKIPGAALSADGRSVDWNLTRRALNGGASVVSLGLQNRFAQLRRLALEVKRLSGHPVHINAYLTPHGSRALPAHRDPYSVFVFQVAGTKRWSLGEDPVTQTTLAPGDMLHMREGTTHAAHTDDSASLHFTVAMHESSEPVPGPSPEGSLAEFLRFV